jgi:hypothetical protein
VCVCLSVCTSDALRGEYERERSAWLLKLSAAYEVDLALAEQQVRGDLATSRSLEILSIKNQLQEKKQRTLINLHVSR